MANLTSRIKQLIGADGKPQVGPDLHRAHMEIRAEAQEADALQRSQKADAMALSRRGLFGFFAAAPVVAPAIASSMRDAFAQQNMPGMIDAAAQQNAVMRHGIIMTSVYMACTCTMVYASTIYRGERSL